MNNNRHLEKARIWSDEAAEAELSVMNNECTGEGCVRCRLMNKASMLWSQASSALSQYAKSNESSSLSLRQKEWYRKRSDECYGELNDECSVIIEDDE